MIVGAREMETGWGSSGPEAGYFPLRIGILIVVAALAVGVLELRRTNSGQTLIKHREAAWNIVLFAAPLVTFIAATPWLGIYLAAAAYLMVAVGLISRVRLTTTLAVALLTPAALFLLFEFVFRTPLPKGPLGPLLGML